MNKKAICKETAGALTVLLVLVGLPLLLWHWRAAVVPGHYPPGSKVIHLTAIAEGGVWTDQPVAGYAYWWKKPARVSEIRLTQGDHVVLLLHSADVQHSISIPDLHIGPVAIPAGHTVEVEFDAKEAGELAFMCTAVCGKHHNRLEGRFVIAERTVAQNSGHGSQAR